MPISLPRLTAGLSLFVAIPLLANTAQAADSADGVIARAERAMGGRDLKSLAFSGSGSGATFGQAYVPGNAWPKLNIVSLARIMDYSKGAMREESARTRAEPTGGGAVPLMGTGEQRQIGFVDGKHAWNQAGQAMVAAPVAFEARQHDLWTSPHGVLIAAKRNKATVQFKREGDKTVAAVVFSEPGVLSATAFVNDDGLVERVEAKHPHPVIGDLLVVTEYSDYRDQGGVKFPAKIRQSHAGHPTLDLTVKDVQINAQTNFSAPDSVRNFAEKAASEKVADGVWFLAGGSHNSVAIEMKDHLVVVEAPLYDGRSAVALAEAKKLAPGKPVRTVINSHHHFDHAGGLRAAAAEGASLLVAADAKPYFEKVFANPNRIKPDALARSGKKPLITGYSGKTVLGDGARSIEIHSIESSVHSKGFTLVYLPQEKLLIEADAYTPSPPGSAPPPKPNDNHVNLIENIERLKLSVERIAPLHGRVVPVADLYLMAGRKPPN